MPTPTDGDYHHCDGDEMEMSSSTTTTTTTPDPATTSITLAIESFGGNAAASSPNNNNNNIDNHSLNGSGIINDTIFWEKAHIATCLQHATIASSCEQVYKESGTTLDDLKNNEHSGEDEVLLKVCNILGNNKDVCAYIRWDGSIANDDDQTKQQFNEERRQTITPTRQCYCTAAVMECKIMSSNGSGTHPAATGVKESKYIKSHDIHDESMLSAMNQRQVEQLARLSGMYLTDKILLLVVRGDQVLLYHRW